MQLNSILTPERTFCKLPGVSKKRFLTTISEHIAEFTPTLSPDAIYTALVAREQLGSTGIGNGIAIPHCRVGTCDKITGALVTLDQGIDFDAVDDQQVDLLFVLIVPAEETDEHLRVLSGLAHLFHNESYCQKLREQTSNQALFETAIALSDQT